MQIPESDNIHHQYAYKTGYRMALEGKTINSMPSAMRREPGMQDFFQQGLEQGQADLADGLLTNSETDWKSRFIWGTLMILGGIASAQLIIQNYEDERAELTAKIAAPPPVQQTKITPLPTSIPSSDAVQLSNTLTLLSAEQRNDLIANKQEQAISPPKLGPLIAPIDSPIKVSNAVFTLKIQDKNPTDVLDSKIPKYVRQLYFYTEIEAPGPDIIYHRWRFNNQYLATIPLRIDKNGFRTWSSKKMSSAWQGRWDVEVLNNQQDVIFRKSFTYGASP